ncbi:MAG: hypothetical protein ACRDWV_08225 [Acidimicrobiales bacterium]
MIDGQLEVGRDQYRSLAEDAQPYRLDDATVERVQVLTSAQRRDCRRIETQMVHLHWYRSYAATTSTSAMAKERDRRQFPGFGTAFQGRPQAWLQKCRLHQHGACAISTCFKQVRELIWLSTERQSIDSAAALRSSLWWEVRLASSDSVSQRRPPQVLR